MKLIYDMPQSVELDDTYSLKKSEVSAESVINESKKPSIFDDDFQGIEWPVKKGHKDIMTDVDYFFIPGNIFYSDDDF